VPLTVACWNVLADSYVLPERYAGARREDLDPRVRNPRLVERIAQLDGDVVCLQEVESRLGATLSRELDWPCCTALKRGRSEGVEIRVRPPVQLERAHTFAYRDGSGHVAAIAVVRHQGRSLAVATTHLKWDAAGTPVESRLGLRQAAELVTALGAYVPSLPVVVCGDLNVTSDDPVLERFADSGLTDAYASLPHPTCVVNGRARRIDFILHTADLAAKPRPIASLRDGAVVPSSELPSDHAPLAVEFDWLT
jgi:endonuclease/exonuclease/phosphatase family metal-dependent hydrolase